jgi:hypothetical protein
MSNTTLSSEFEGSWEEFVTGVKLLSASRYTIWAATTLFVYDILLTIVDEVCSFFFLLRTCSSFSKHIVRAGMAP